MIERALTPKTKMILINSPSNPSGAVFAWPELEKIVAMAKDRGIWILTDECYHRFFMTAPGVARVDPGVKETVVVAGSLSKTYAMTGWRIGFVLAPAAVATGITKLQSHSTSNPRRSRKGRGRSAERTQESVAIMLAEYKKRRDYVSRGCGHAGVKTQVPQGAFYAYPNVSAAYTGGSPIRCSSPKSCWRKSSSRRAGRGLRTNEHVRISYATSMKELEKGLDRIAKFVAARV